MKIYIVRNILLSFVVLFSGYTHSGIELYWQDSGNISLSVDAEGNIDTLGGTISVDKPTGGGTVRRAFLMASSNGGRIIKNGDVLLANNPITWDKSVFADIPSFPKFFNNTIADVTSIIKPLLDNAPTGINEISIQEIGTIDIDGTVLVVIFDKEEIQLFGERGVILLFGKQSTLGDSFIINLSEPIDPDNIFDSAYMGIGISYGYQNTATPTQFSLIDVNGARLTSSAGGEDDGLSANGGLITVGGIGDSYDNPSAYAPPTDPRTDDEYYRLNDFMKDTDESILVNTINPSNDDNIFFTYFFTSVPSAVLPPLPPPGPRSLNTADLLGQIDSTKPTVVLTHGLQAGPYDPSDVSMRTDLWTSFAENKAGALIRDQLGTEVNILQYTWSEAFHGEGALHGDNYILARTNVADAGANLAKRLFEELGSGYNQPIHFIAHSLGTPVNAYAARAFLNLQPAVNQAQVTILDYPNAIEVDKIPFLSTEDAEIYGFDQNFFASVLPTNKEGLDLRIDNYFAPTHGSGVGSSINGPVYNHQELIEPNDVDNLIFEETLFADNNHSGVHQWYRWTIKPNGFDKGDFCSTNTPYVVIPDILDDNYLDQSLNPCSVGWYWSINGPKPGSTDGTPRSDNFPEKFPENFGGTPISIENSVRLHLDNFTDYGCGIEPSSTSETVICMEMSSPFAIAEVDIPEEANYLSFKYNFVNIGDGDYAGIFIDDIPVWVLAGSSAIEGKLTDSGPIPLQGLTGNRKITIALYGVGQKNANIEISDFAVFSVEANQNQPPIADAGSDQTVYQGYTVVLNGSKSFDPEKELLTFLWEQTDGPTVTLVGGETVTPSFTPTMIGTYTFNLTVSDGQMSASDNVVINVTYKFAGFLKPVDNPPAWNIVKSGSVVPVKFSLNGDQGMAIFQDNTPPVIRQVSCESTIGLGPINNSATAGNSGLNYDPQTDTYNYIWKTDNNWIGTCQQLTLRLIDGTEHSVNFKFLK